jgi:hypothetical protein
VTVTVAPVAPGGGTPTGTATITLDGTALPPAALTNGKATLKLAGLSVGTHTVTATYSGDANDLPSNSGPYSQEIGQAATTTTLASSVNPNRYGQNGGITATVKPIAPGTGTPTGTVTFSINGVAQTPQTLVNGKATLPFAGMTEGDNTITATYSGDTDMVASAAIPIDQVMKPDADSTTLSTSRATIKAGQTATITATAKASAPGSGTPSGTITFVIDGAAQAPVALVAGKAQLAVTAALGAGTHVIVADYNGDANFTTSASAPLTETVN